MLLLCYDCPTRTVTFDRPPCLQHASAVSSAVSVRRDIFASCVIQLSPRIVDDVVVSLSSNNDNPVSPARRC
jgi:hypothetical protein